MAARADAAVATVSRSSLPAVACAAAIAVGVSLAAADALPPLPRAEPEAVGLQSLKLREAHGLLARYVDERKVAGAVAAVARHGKLAWIDAAGTQDLDRRSAMSDRSIFRIYSMSKAVTAAAAMMLQEQGRFALDDAVAKYLPAFNDVTVRGAAAGAARPPSRPVTVRDLMLHTSGLEHRTSEIYRSARVRSRDITLPQFISNIVRVPLMEDPGTRFRYSEGTTVLGRLVEIWSGQPLDRFLEERIFGPLRMVDTGFWVRPEQRDRLTTVYSPAESGGLKAIEIEEVPFTQKPALLEGAVGLVATVPDFLRFAQMLLNKGELDGARILRPATVETMTKNGLADAVLAARGGTMGWGLGNVNVALDSGEYGWDGTAGTIFWNDPAHDMVTILMTQSVPANPDSLRQRFKAIITQAVHK
jgi:CubicO group peptidase (beta-lactamase class C family)